MARPTVGLKLPKTREGPMRPDRLSAGEWGQRAERLGYESIWTSEGWGTDAFVDLTEVACHTDDLRMGTAIVNVFSRSPAVLAMASTSLARVSDGRAILGVGASHPRTVENLHSMDYHRPVRRSHEAIELVKRLGEASTEPVEYDGEVFQVSGFEPLGTTVPVYNAALGEANRRLTGRLADGWLPYLLPLSRIDEAFETVVAAAREAGRDPDDITVTPQVLAAVADDPDVARAPIRRYVARYIGAYDAYKNAIAETFPDEATRVADAWRDGDRSGAIEHMTDEMVAEFGVAGTPETARERFLDVLDVPVIDRPILYVPDVADDELKDRTIEALAPQNL